MKALMAVGLFVLGIFVTAHEAAAAKKGSTPDVANLVSRCKIALSENGYFDWLVENIDDALDNRDTKEAASILRPFVKIVPREENKLFLTLTSLRDEIVAVRDGLREFSSADVSVKNKVPTRVDKTTEVAALPATKSKPIVAVDRPASLPKVSDFAQGDFKDVATLKTFIYTSVDGALLTSNLISLTHALRSARGLPVPRPQHEKWNPHIHVNVVDPRGKTPEITTPSALVEAILKRAEKPLKKHPIAPQQETRSLVENADILGALELIARVAQETRNQTYLVLVGANKIATDPKFSSVMEALRTQRLLNVHLVYRLPR